VYEGLNTGLEYEYARKNNNRGMEIQRETDRKNETIRSKKVQLHRHVYKRKRSKKNRQSERESNED